MPWYFVPFLGELVWSLICKLWVVVHVATRAVMHVADGRQGAAAGLVGPGPDADIILPGFSPGDAKRTAMLSLRSVYRPDE